MSESTAALRRKIESAGELRSVVRTMKALAASSIGQYERSAQALEEYYRTVELGLIACFRGHPRPRRGGPSRRGPVGVVVFGSDQGLVGQFNEVVVEHALRMLEKIPGERHVWAVGERAQARLSDAGVAVSGGFAVPHSVAGIAPLVGRILVSCEGRYDADGELHLLYNRRGPVSLPGSSIRAEGVYTLASQRLLPLDEEWLEGLAQLPWPTPLLPEAIGGETTLRTLIREYLFVSLFRACADSLVSENASRLAAMERADKNIDELLTALNASFHQLRQSAIDEELFDLVAGFEAMAQPDIQHQTKGSP